MSYTSLRYHHRQKSHHSRGTALEGLESPGDT